MIHVRLERAHTDNTRAFEGCTHRQHTCVWRVPTSMTHVRLEGAHIDNTRAFGGYTYNTYNASMVLI